MGNGLDLKLDAKSSPGGRIDAAEQTLPAGFRDRPGVRREPSEQDVDREIERHAPRVYPKSVEIQIAGKPVAAESLSVDRKFGAAYVQLARFSNILSYEFDGQDQLKIFARGGTNSKPLGTIEFSPALLRDTELRTPRIDAAIAISEIGTSYVKGLMRQGTLFGVTEDPSEALKISPVTMVGTAAGAALGSTLGIKKVLAGALMGFSATQIAESVPGWIRKDLLLHPVLDLFQQSNRLSESTGNRVKFDLVQTMEGFNYSSYITTSTEISEIAVESISPSRFLSDIKFNRLEPKVGLSSLLLARSMAQVYDDTVKYLNSDQLSK